MRSVYLDPYGAGEPPTLSVEAIALHLQDMMFVLSLHGDCFDGKHGAARKNEMKNISRINI